MKFKIILGLSFILGPFKIYASDLKVFYTDYCTGFNEGTLSHPNLWKDCCFEHDLRYWFGGTKKDEDFADLQLKKCVKNKAGTFYANIMYYGVRVGHLSPIKHKTYWGWGWTPKSKEYYAPLTKDKIKIIKERIKQVELTDEYIQAFLRKYSL